MSFMQEWFPIPIKRRHLSAWMMKPSINMETEADVALLAVVLGSGTPPGKPVFFGTGIVMKPMFFEDSIPTTGKPSSS